MTAKKITKETKTGLQLLRAPFEERHIGKLPKPLKWQTDAPKKEKKKCDICGGWHHPSVIHLDYVGHAALTDRLLDVDPHWYWQPVAFNEMGLPAFDETGGLWIRLFIHDGEVLVNHLGYGHAALASFKDIGSREKEVIGDALRNAAMRFGAALDLWHKGDLHEEIEEEEEKEVRPKGCTALQKNIRPFIDAILRTTSIEEFEQIKIDYKEAHEKINKEWPEYMKAVSGEQTKSFNVQIKEHKARLQGEEDVDKQQKEDMGEGDNFVNPLQ